jgi:hypothetical protein
VSHVAITKVFAIHAPPEAIWEALWADLGRGDAGSYTLEGSTWPSRLGLLVTLGGVRCRLEYDIAQEEDHTEVSATITPLGRRYALFHFLTFGHVRRNYEALLVAGLANLKAAVERGEAGTSAGEGDPP